MRDSLGCRQASLGLLVAVLCSSEVAHAYPSSIVFAPTGESLAFGEASAYGYGGVVLKSTVPQTFLNPWFGVQLGILPGFDYAKGVGFGGLEIGADLLQVDQAVEGARGILNAKIQLVTESEEVPWIPALGIGFMDFFPGQQTTSLNMGYVALTKTLDITKNVSLGRIHGGYAHAFNTGPDPRFGGTPVYYGSAPFDAASGGALLLGYESPMLGPLYLGVDTIGGVSEVSSTNLGVGYIPNENVSLMAGWTFSNDRNAPYDGLFFNLGGSFSLFGEAEAAPPAEAPTTPDPASASP